MSPTKILNSNSPILTPEEHQASLVSTKTLSYSLQLWVWPFECGLQPVLYSLSGQSIKSMCFHFQNMDVMWDSVKCFAQVQIDDVSSSSLIHQCCHLIVESNQICQVLFSLNEVMCAVASHLCVFHVPYHRICFMILPGTEVKMIGL